MVFVVSGAEKLLSPYQNFMLVIQGYDIVHNVFLEELAARVMPWVEFLTGILLVLGLWTKWALRLSALLYLTFIVFLSQAIIRGLNLSECGCFGDFISFPLPVILSMDSGMFILIGLLIYQMKRTNSFSLDAYFEKQK